MTENELESVGSDEARQSGTSSLVLSQLSRHFAATKWASERNIERSGLYPFPAYITYVNTPPSTTHLLQP